MNYISSPLRCVCWAGALLVAWLAATTLRVGYRLHLEPSSSTRLEKRSRDRSEIRRNPLIDGQAQEIDRSGYGQNREANGRWNDERVRSCLERKQPPSLCCVHIAWALCTSTGCVDELNHRLAIILPVIDGRVWQWSTRWMVTGVLSRDLCDSFGCIELHTTAALLYAPPYCMSSSSWNY